MEIQKTVLASILSIITLFISAKLMGHRQISQLDVFDYISGITIGSIAAELATNLEEPYKPLIAMIIYILFSVGINFATNKFPKMRKYFNGTPSIILDDGKFNRENMIKAKLDLGEFLMMCRQDGYFDISQIQTAVYEYNGKLTILPTSSCRPLIPSDIGVSPAKESYIKEIIMDGRVLTSSLERIGRDKNWLNSQLKAQGYSSASEVFLGLIDDNYNLSLYKSKIKNHKA